jgi:hypothetical protein
VKLRRSPVAPVYALKGASQILVGDAWLSVSEGGFVRIPRTVAYDFRNTSLEAAGLLNLYIPGDFERDMPGLVEWFRQNR